MTTKNKLLSTPAELKIILDPQRQRILHELELRGTPATAKQLADALQMAPSSAKHHLKLLESIGMVAVDHTESIHGITATFYALCFESYSLSTAPENLDVTRLLMENSLREALNAYWAAAPGTDAAPDSTLSLGVLHATPAEVAALCETLRSFAAAHRTPAPGTQPYRYAALVFAAPKADAP